MTNAWISKVEINDGTKILLDVNDIVVFVGPNNAGKSAALKDINALLEKKTAKSVVVKEIEIQKTGSVSDLLAYVQKFSRADYSMGMLSYRGMGFNIQSQHLGSYWTIERGLVAGLHSLFVRFVTTVDRLSSANPPSNISITTSAPQHPIHFLQLDDQLEEKFSDYFRQAFGMDLILHRNAGNEVPLYTGQKPIPEPNEDRISFGYLKKLEQLPRLHEQGDGMRSFVGVLLNTFMSGQSIVLIDEPEAFLHPPQARLLGKMLAKDLPSSKQLFLSTHSEDFLKGLLDSGNPNIKVVRMSRNASSNPTHQLEKTDIRTIWSDSLLRHSNILNGLFHTKVIVCESDSDCRFYSAILSALYDNTGSISPDMLFVHCGGKHRIPVVVNALRKLNVPLKVIVDFDILSDKKPLQEIYEGLGGTWTEVESDWKLVKKEIESKRPQFLTDDLRVELDSILNSTIERVFPPEKIAEVKRALKKASPWTEAKANGKSYIPSGNATQAFERIQTKFEQLGLLVLEVGELEGFAKTVGSHGPKWVNEVLFKDLKTDPELETARKFITELVK